MVSPVLSHHSQWFPLGLSWLCFLSWESSVLESLLHPLGTTPMNSGFQPACVLHFHWSIREHPMTNSTVPPTVWVLKCPASASTSTHSGEQVLGTQDRQRQEGKDLGKRQKALFYELHISQTVSLVLGSGKLKVTWLGQKTILRSLIRPTIRRGRGT